ncbi:glutaredoxin family protein [bacterium]|nr:glutaredoxin family protein [bacterium]
MRTITIYTTPTCPYCKMAKDFFQKNQLEYSEKNVATDHAAREEAVAKSGHMGVPVIDIDGTVVVGFNEPAIRKALGI